MNKLIIATALLASSLLMSCRTTVRTPKTSTDVKVGSLHPVQNHSEVNAGRV